MRISKIARPMLACAAMTAVLSFTACSDDGLSFAKLKGKLIDSAVGGVSYTTSPSGQSGVTDADGSYDYAAGDTVTFKIGGISLGTVTATGTITPATLGGGSANKALNIAILLQSLDADGNPDNNGITIPAAVLTAAAGKTLDFTVDPATFAGAGNTVLGDLVTAAGPNAVKASQSDAQNHVSAQARAALVGSWSEKDAQGHYSILTLMQDGRYLLTSTNVVQGCTAGMDYGTYQFNALTNQVVSTNIIDTNADNDDCPGLDAAEDDNVQFAVDGDTLTVSYDKPQGGTCPADENIGSGTRCGSRLTRVVESGLNGGWVLDAYDRFQTPIVLTLLPNGDYVMGHLRSAEPEVTSSAEALIVPTKSMSCDNERGVEQGKWSVGAANALTITTSVDTNCEAGASNLGSATMKLNNGRLEIQPAQEAPSVFDRVSTVNSAG